MLTDEVNRKRRQAAVQDPFEVQIDPFVGLNKDAGIFIIIHISSLSLIKICLSIT